MKWHQVKASSFADPADVLAFNQCKARGNSDAYCFRYGDNGIGCWGDDTTAMEPMCALPPDDMIAKWGTIRKAKHKMVVVLTDGDGITCKLADRMPWKKNIRRGGAKLDLNMGAAVRLDLEPPFLVPAKWAWVEDL